MNERTQNALIAVGSFIALCALLCHTARSAEVPVAVLDTSVAYETEQLAAQAALARAVTQSDTLEQAGGIARLGGKFYITSAVSNGDPEHFAIRIRLQGALVAIYHTHPGKAASDDFSKDDRNVAAAMRVHSYIRSVVNGGVYLLADGRVTQIGEHSLCHGIECKEYYALQRLRVQQLYGMVR